jgi:predicted GTPase
MIDIFISYSRMDAEYVDWIKPVLKRMQLEDGIKYYRDIDNILPGEEIMESIDISISRAKMIICFLSNNFFASEFIQKNELPLIEKAASRGTIILPVIVDNVFLPTNSIFNKVHHLNPGGQTLNTIKAINGQVSFAAFFNQKVTEVLKNFSWNKLKPVKARYNIVVVGKTGAGKSELVNYMFGERKRNADIGTPVAHKGFQETKFDIGGVSSAVYDSAGLELGSYEKWKTELDDELNKRSTREPVENWFHTVLYCVQATGSRIEPFEIDIINKFIEDNYKVIVVLTKCFIDEAKVQKLETAIQNELDQQVTFVRVNSADEKFGTAIVKSFGKAQLTKEIQAALAGSLTSRIPARCISLMREHIDRKCDEQINYVQEVALAYKKNKVTANVKKALKKIMDDISAPNGRFKNIILSETRATLELYHQLAGIMEHIIISEDESFVMLNEQLEDLPEITSLRKMAGEFFENSYDWDFTEKYGEFVDVLSKIAATPLILFATFFETAGNHIEELVQWKGKIIDTINDFRERVKAELESSRDYIQNLYTESLKKQTLM